MQEALLESCQSLVPFCKMYSYGVVIYETEPFTGVINILTLLPNRLPVSVHMQHVTSQCSRTIHSYDPCNGFLVQSSAIDHKLWPLHSYAIRYLIMSRNNALMQPLQ